jgi:hypothetical protein
MPELFFGYSLDSFLKKFNEWVAVAYLGSRKKSADKLFPAFFEGSLEKSPQVQ